MKPIEERLNWQEDGLDLEFRKVRQSICLESYQTIVNQDSDAQRISEMFSEQEIADEVGQILTHPAIKNSRACPQLCFCI